MTVHSLDHHSKLQLLERLREDVAHGLRLAQTAASDAAREATHEEAKAEDKYDTRALELTYLAAGQNERIEGLRKTLQVLHFWQPPREAPPLAAPGSLVQAEDDAGPQWYWLVPASASGRYAVGDTEVQVVSTTAPLGEALLGAAVDDDVRVGTRVLTVLAVR